MKYSPGYNFAYEPQDSGRYGTDGDRRKYGSGIVVFKAPYVYIWHDFDEEPQAIFWGPDATDIIEVAGVDGSYYIEDPASGDELEFNSLLDVISYLDSRS
jgi:hypothetical protein